MPLLVEAGPGAGVMVLADATSGHGLHGIETVIPFLMLVMILLFGEGPKLLRRFGPSWPERPMVIVVMFSIIGATIHAVVFPEHVQESLLYGAFFAVSFVAHLLWAGLALCRPRRWILAAGLAGNLGIVVLWTVTRTLGIPVGPSAGEVEAVGALDIAATACETGIVIFCAWLLIHAGSVVVAAHSTATEPETRQLAQPLRSMPWEAPRPILTLPGKHPHPVPHPRQSTYDSERTGHRTRA